MSHQVAMRPTRCLMPEEVVEMDIQDTEQVSEAENGYLLVVDKATKFLFAFPLQSTSTEPVARSW